MDSSQTLRKLLRVVIWLFLISAKRSLRRKNSIETLMPATTRVMIRTVKRLRRVLNFMRSTLLLHLDDLDRGPRLEVLGLLRHHQLARREAVRDLGELAGDVAHFHVAGLRLVLLRDHE